MSRRTSDEMEADLDRLEEALHEPRTLRYLVHRFHVNRVTIHRWLKRLEEERGAQIVRVGAGRPTKYRI